MEVLLLKWLSSEEIDTAIRVQTLSDAVWISHSANTQKKRLNPTVLLPARGK